MIDRFDIFQSKFGKIYEFGWWDLEKNSADAGTQFISTECQEKFQTRGVRLTLAAPDHQEMDGQVEVTQITLLTIAHSLMVHVQVSEAYINFP